MVYSSLLIVASTSVIDADDAKYGYGHLSICDTSTAVPKRSIQMIDMEILLNILNLI